ncbi:hypothetical protein [Kitasatospora purpeofusca]|uniref:hypothetical protein n=1 Tax=Kitasatospora purpeofusca TaxID=67352 RepID=UPI002A5A35B0|nr:hypothetical protein [Kitasatospora purpeofusca]MDY0813008.1 hypothetical protein [Kitasatospora purpeofusca]
MGRGERTHRPILGVVITRDRFHYASTPDHGRLIAEAEAKPDAQPGTRVPTTVVAAAELEHAVTVTGTGLSALLRAGVPTAPDAG